MFSLKKLGTAGQATTEYILILVVVIALFKFIGGPLMKNLTSWGFKIIGPGGYYSCLMENGLLPGFTYTNTGANSVGCTSHKADALESLTNQGEGILGGEGAEKFQTAEERAKNKGKKRKKASKKKRKRKKPKRTKTSTLGSGSGGSFQGGGSQRSHAGRKRLSRKPSSGSQTESRIPSSEASEKEEVYKTGRKKASNKERRRKVRRRQQGYLGFEVPEEEQRPASFKEKFSSKKKAFIQNKNSRIKTKKRIERKPQFEEDKPLQFGEFLKYLFIAALVIILLVVGGSQVLELKNKD